MNEVDADEGQPDPGVDDDGLVEDAVEHVDEAGVCPSPKTSSESVEDGHCGFSVWCF